MRTNHADQFWETLEPRQLLATFVVTSPDQSGEGTLRDAVNQANSNPGADVIEFDSSLEGAAIGLHDGQISIGDDLTIRGLGEDLLSISGQRISRVFLIERDAVVDIRDLTIKWGQQDNGLGGQIYVDQGADLTLRRVTMHDSQALWGGALYNNFASVSLFKCTVSEGKAFRHGGGINSAGGPLTVVNTTFVDNFASLDGGAIYSLNTASIAGSTFTGNIARDNGGAILNGADMTITNSTISGNQADDAGGAVYNLWSLSLEIYNSTIVENTSPNTGGVANVNVSATITSTIIAQNSGGDTSGSVISTSNLIGGDPELGPLAYNGGPTQTRAVLEGSPAVGNGVNPLGLTTDQRGSGFGRSYNGAIDIGAYQRQPMTQVVDTNLDVDNGNYAPGDLSLREAIARSNSDPEFFPTITFDPLLNDQTITLTGGELTISESVDIQGPGRNLLRLFANYNSRLLYITGEEVSISGLAFDAGSGGQGGAIYAAASRLQLTDVGILNSRATGHGGGLYLASGDATVSDSVINSNTTDVGGGGIYAQAGTLTINTSQVTANEASFAGGVGSESTLTLDGCIVDGNTADGNGGGIESWNFQPDLALLTIRNSTISGNSAGDNGGGVRSYNGQLTISTTEIRGNTATASGGGVHAEQAAVNVSISASTIEFNFAFDGGGVFVFDGTLLLHQSTVSGNSATGEGGGVHLANSTAATIRSSTVSGNTADDRGGGIGVFLSSPDQTLTILNSTITRNISDADSTGPGSLDLGGGVFLDGGTTAMYSTIVAENTSSTEPNDISGAALDAGSSNNLVSNAASAGGLRESNDNLIGFDVELGDLADNGGPTRTHALPEGSPAIDAGSNRQNLSVDQRGNDRVQGDAPDIGAYESAFTAGFSLDVIDGGVVRATSLSNGTHLSTARNANGELIVFTEANSSWSVLRLNDYTSAPDATGDPIIWTDPNDGLAYVAAPSNNGFLLFRRAGNGSWSYQDVAGQTGNRADAPAGTLGYFVTRPGTGSPLVYITGVNGSGEIVAYFQNSASRTSQQASWSLYNISDDLASQGMSTPTLSKMTTYVTSWNQWTLAGLDGAGNVQGVWVNVATFTTWRVDNLSAITGAAPLTGELDVTLTSWGGIRFAGADASGQLVATWWNPSLGGGNWKQTDLSASVPGNEAPALNGGQLTAWFTLSDRISYAGYDNNGDVVSFYWQPGDGGSWNSDNLTSELTNRDSRPAGTITTYVSSTGDAGIYGVSDNRDVVRLWAEAGSQNFTLDILSELAVRV